MESEGNFSRMDFLTRLRGRKNRNLALRMTPMVDMIFLLLIFFLVAAKWKPQENYLPMQLASASPVIMQTPAPALRILVITITAGENGCLVNIGPDTRVNLGPDLDAGLTQFAAAVKSALAKSGNFSCPVELICAPQVKWEYFARLYNTLYGLGLTDITFKMTQ